MANLLSNDKMHTPSLKFNDLRIGGVHFVMGCAHECRLLGSSSLAKYTILLVPNFKKSQHQGEFAVVGYHCGNHAAKQLLAC